MKINKKILIPVFATAMGLSVMGGIGGAVAWYQYNSKVSTSFIGTSVADTGVLQIGYKEAGSNDITWGRDFTKMSGNKLYPVTFGELKTVSNKANCLPDKAYMYPEAGAGEGYVSHKPADPDFPHWSEAEEGKHYYQFELYFKATQTDSTKESGSRLVARPVYITKSILKCLDANGDELDADNALNALRIHMEVEGSDNKLLSNVARTNLELSGELDLDDNGSVDTYHSTLLNNKLADYGERQYGPDAGETIEDGEAICYGIYGEKQSTEKLESYLASRDTDGSIKASDAEKALFTTKDDANATPIKVKFTVWLEGWDALKVSANDTSKIWNPHLSAGCEMQFGLQFDTGIFRGSDLTPQA